MVDDIKVFGAVVVMGILSYVDAGLVVLEDDDCG